MTDNNKDISDIILQEYFNYIKNHPDLDERNWESLFSAGYKIANLKSQKNIDDLNYKLTELKLVLHDVSGMTARVFSPNHELCEHINKTIKKLFKD